MGLFRSDAVKTLKKQAEDMAPKRDTGSSERPSALSGFPTFGHAQPTAAEGTRSSYSS